MLSTGDWALQQDKQLVAALQGALQAGPEWEIDWDTLVPGRSMEQVCAMMVCVWGVSVTVFAHVLCCAG